MKRATFLVCLFLVLCLTGMTGCRDEEGPENTNAATHANTNAPTAASSPTVSSSAPGIKGTLSANPNPIKVCDGSGTGKTTLSWTLSQAKRIQIRVGTPTGGTLADSAQTSGKVETGNWATDGATFYLQDVATGQTISSVTVKVNNEGCK